MKTLINKTRTTKPRLFGVLFVIIAGSGYGTGPWIATNLERNGANPMGFLTARFVVSAMILVAVRLIHLRGSPWPNREVFIKTFLLGAFGFFLTPLLYFIAIEHIDSGLVVVIFYAYPAFTVLLSWAVYKHKPTLVIVGCLVVTLTGVWLTAGQVGDGKTIGIVLTLCAALVHTIYVVAGTHVAKKSDTLTMITITICGSAFAFIVVSLFGPQSLAPEFPNNTRGWVLIAFFTIFGTILATAAFFAGLKRIGPGVTSMVETFEAVVTIFLGVALLSESITAIQIMGTALVLGSIVVLGWAESRIESGGGTVIDVPIT